MTAPIITWYTALVCLLFALSLGATVHASEVTGTLSSNTSSTTELSGNIGGTVTSDSGDSGGSSSSGGTRASRSSTSNAPQGSVLGAATGNIDNSPGFPNAGTAPAEAQSSLTFWSMLLHFITNLAAF